MAEPGAEDDEWRSAEDPAGELDTVQRIAAAPVAETADGADGDDDDDDDDDGGSSYSESYSLEFQPPWVTYLPDAEPAAPPDGEPAPPPAAATVTATTTFEGVNEGTHWLVPGRVLCGKSPQLAGRPASVRQFVDGLVRAGVTAFVSLEESMTWWGRPYPELVTDPPHRVRFVHCPMPDHHVLADAGALAVVRELHTLLDQGHVIYLHCMGGHGRTGTVCCQWLQAEVRCTAAQAMAFLALAHQGRTACRGYRCALNEVRLEASAQTAQCERLTPALHSLLSADASQDEFRARLIAAARAWQQQHSR